MTSYKFIHEHKEFPELINIISETESIHPALVEKDYWIMHCLYGLQKLGIHFELKGGTSLSKGHGIIKRFSEDIDIRIEPKTEWEVKANKNHAKPSHIESRKRFYDLLITEIKIAGIISIIRDYTFDDIPQYRSGGIRLLYKSATQNIADLKDGILLEVGFDDVSPNAPKNISSWVYDYAVKNVQIIDNRAHNVLCYHPGYTLVEKLQTISTKFRTEQTDNKFPPNFMRHYYDVYMLLAVPEVQAFIGTEAYLMHKEKRFRIGDNKIISENEAFMLNDPKVRVKYEESYNKKRALYYSDPPLFSQILDRIREWSPKL